MLGSRRRSLATAILGGIGILDQVYKRRNLCEDHFVVRSCPTPGDHFIYSFPANNPSEDRYFVNKELKKYQIYGVFDGHGGWQVSEFVVNNLPSILFPKLTVDTSKPLNVVLQETFLELESNYVQNIKSSYNIGFAEVGKVGCCANISVVSDGILTVANSGDCRTIIGTTLDSSTGKVSYEGNPVISEVNGELYTVYHVGRDHNARTPLEKYLLSHDHPNEDNIVKCKNEHACYVKGRLQLTRAIGDLYLKSHDFNVSSAPASGY